MENKIKVLHINCNYFGNNPVHKTMIEKMNEIEDIDSYVFCPVTKKITEGTNDKIIASNCIKKTDRLFFYNKSKKIRNSLLKTFDINNFDIIHAYTLFTDGNVAYELNKKFNIPYVVAIRNTDINTFFKYKPYLKKRGLKIMKSAKAIFFLSKPYMDIVINKYVSKEDKEMILKKCHIIPNGINDFWQNNVYYNEESLEKKIQSLNNKNLTIVYAGNIDKNKNLIATCKAIEMLKTEGWKVNYIVAGRIKDKKVYNAIRNEIDYRGILKKEELANIYRESDIFVMPSFTESFGISYAEAISQGLPVIYTQNEGFDSQFKEGIVGYHVNPNSPKDIEKSILKIINNYKLIVYNLSEKVCKYSWKLINEHYYKYYKTAKKII